MHPPAYSRWIAAAAMAATLPDLPALAEEIEPDHPEALRLGAP